jgi:hypothetical protein
MFSFKKTRDRAQALATCKIVRQYLPAFQFKSEELKIFPGTVVEAAADTFKQSGFPTFEDIDRQEQNRKMSETAIPSKGLCNPLNCYNQC